MTLNNEQKMELNNKLFNFFNKEIYDWVAKNFGTQEAEDPSWSIKDLSAHLASELLKKVKSDKKPFKKYEFVMILKAGSDIAVELENIKTKLEELGGKLIDNKENETEIKFLPYEIQGEKRGEYHYWDIELAGDMAQQLSSWLSLQENVLRHLIVRAEERRK